MNSRHLNNRWPQNDKLPVPSTCKIVWHRLDAFMTSAPDCKSMILYYHSDGVLNLDTSGSVIILFGSNQETKPQRGFHFLTGSITNM